MESYITGKFDGLLQDILPRLAKKPGRVVAIIPGAQVVWDDCCEGQLTARLSSLTPTYSQGPQCGVTYWQAVGEVTLLRCSVALNEDGSAPSPAVLKSEGVDALKDTDAVLASLGGQDWISSIVSWVPATNTGGCRGITVTFNFNLDQPS